MEIGDAWQHRSYLLDIAFRMLGNIADAEDAVQEAFSRLVRTDIHQIDDVRGWLIVVVGRLCLDRLRSAPARREVLTASGDLEGRNSVTDPADRITLDDSVRSALFVVLERLTPAERVVFVLHDVFQFSFTTVASIVGRSPAACRQLASRARHHVGSGAQPRFAVDLREHDRLAQRFIAACAGGDLHSLTRLLDPDVTGDVEFGIRAAPQRAVGRAQVARGLLAHFGPQTGRSLVSQPIDGRPGVLAFRGNRLVGILILEQPGGLVSHVRAIADRSQLGSMLR
jgi:RNA polymerase sigma-70 factor (ECF subfamily)